MNLREYREKICDGNCDYCFLNNVKSCQPFCNMNKSTRYRLYKRGKGGYGESLCKSRITWYEIATELYKYTLKRDIKKHKVFFDEINRLIHIQII